MVVTTTLHGGLGIVRGDVFSLRRTITNIPSGLTITGAYLTLKASYSDADPGLFQKHITTTNVAGTGRIEDDGSSGVGVIRFDLVAADTTAMTADVPYYFDIECVMSSGDILTVERGTTSSLAQVTTS